MSKLRLIVGGLLIAVFLSITGTSLKAGTPLCRHSPIRLQRCVLGQRLLLRGHSLLRIVAGPRPRILVRRARGLLRHPTDSLDLASPDTQICEENGCSPGRYWH